MNSLLSFVECSSNHTSDQGQLTASAFLFSALADETRLSLLQRLAQEGPASIKVLTSNCRMTRQAVTKHLHVLADAGIVQGCRRGRERIYELRATELAAARGAIEQVTRFWEPASMEAVANGHADH